MFDRHIFDDTFDIQINVQFIKGNFIDWIGLQAETFEQTQERPTFTCTKTQLKAEITTLNALKPCSNQTLIDAMTLIPDNCKSYLANLIQA